MIDENSVFVSNLAWVTSEMVLGRHFESYGDIEKVKIFEDQYERSKGLGIVEFESKGNLLYFRICLECT
jgi:RNA recognition motif-containing protein